MKHPSCFALKLQTCPEKSGISLWPQGGRGRNTHLLWELLEEQCFLSAQLHYPYRCMKHVQRAHHAECQPSGSIGCFCNHRPVRGGGHMVPPVFVLSVVLVAAQWAGEALTLFPVRHQLQSADELSLAHTLSLTIAHNYRTFTCRNKRAACSSCSLSPFLSALYLYMLCTLSLSGCVVF